MREEEDNNEEKTIFTPKLELVLAAKSRKQQYTSSPVISHHVSLSLLSSPDDSHSHASVPFSWEEEPGKPKHDLLLFPTTYSKSLDLPPRLLIPSELTKLPLTPTHHRRLLSGLKRWFSSGKKKRRGGDDVSGNSSLIFPSEGGSDTKITRTRRFHYLYEVTRCYFGEVPRKNQQLKK